MDDGSREATKGTDSVLGEGTPDGKVRYRVGATVHPIQARKAWEDDTTWRRAVVVDATDDEVEVRFVTDLTAPDLPDGRPVLVTDRWGVIAFPDEDGNAIAVQPLDTIPGSVFDQAGSGRLRFVGAKRLTTEPDTEPEWVYGTVTGLDDLDRFFLLPRLVVEDVVETIDVITSCDTWGELRRRADAELFDELLGRAGYGTLAEYTEHLHVGRPIPGAIEAATRQYDQLAAPELPGDDEPFGPDDIEGYQTVDYPPSFEYLQQLILPDDLIATYGRSYETTMNGTFTELPPEAGPELVAAMEQRGNRCTEDRQLLQREMFRFERWGS